jgi:hypothetical protein
MKVYMEAKGVQMQQSKEIKDQKKVVGRSCRMRYYPALSAS